MVIGRLLSVNVGQPRTVTWLGRAVTSAIWKAPVDAEVAIRGVNLAGDGQADRRVHGGYNKAIYAYAIEDYWWWSDQLDQGILGPGTFGENLTTEGLDLAAAVVGEHWRIGTATLEVSEPRLPCFKLGMRMGDAAFVDRFDTASRFGTYLRVVDEGEVAAGQEITRLEQPAGGLTIGDLVEAHHDPSPDLLNRIGASPHVPQPWQHMAERMLRRQHGR